LDAFSPRSISPTYCSRREILAVGLVNGCLTLAFVLGGCLVLKRMLQPLGVLTLRGADPGRPVSAFPGLPQPGRQRVRPMFDRFNAMARASANARPSRLISPSRKNTHARTARIRHGARVSNPLGGMLNAIDTIQVHGNDPASQVTGLLKRGLAGIQCPAQPRNVQRRLRHKLSDAERYRRSPFLVQHETGARWLRLDWQKPSRRSSRQRTPVRQITLNLLLNACAAPAPGVSSARLRRDSADRGGGEGTRGDGRRWQSALQRRPRQGQGSRTLDASQPDHRLVAVRAKYPVLARESW
jgi:hypothetical protein